MDISVIIVNWNTRGSLLGCLESVYAGLTDNTTHEVIVVDNGSSDGSAQEVRGAYPEVILIENQKNLGFARANNQALRIAKGQFHVLLNTDVRLAPGALTTLLDFIHQRPEVGMVGGQLLNRDGSRQNSFSAFPSLLTELFNKSLLKILFPWWFPGKYRAFRGPTKVDSLIGACMVVRATTVREIGLMDEAFFFFFEETDWCLRMSKAGWDIYVVPEARIFHGQGCSVEQDKKNAALEYSRSRYLYFKKHKRPLETWILRAGLWVKLLVNLSWATLLWALTLGRLEEFSRRLATLLHILLWHLKRCPRWMGLGDAQARLNLFDMVNGKARITACLITRNEELNVRDCLESLKFISEIIVIDSFSEDNTPAICREYTDNVFQAEWRGFSATKNLCIEQAQNDWVLVIDADERVTPELRAEILDLKVEAEGFYLPRQNYFLGKWIRYCGWYPDYTLRLFRKSLGKFKDREVHESVLLEGKSAHLKNPLIHYTYRDLNSYLARLNRYSTLASAQMLQDAADLTRIAWLRRAKLIVDIVTRPLFNFVKMYLLQLGFLDGFHGFLLSANHSFYVLAKYAKLWESLQNPVAGSAAQQGSERPSRNEENRLAGKSAK